MNNETKYKYAAVILGVVAIAFAYLYFTKPAPTLTGIYENIGDDLEVCSQELASWKEKYGDKASSTAKQEALDEALAACQDKLSDSKESLE